MPGKQKCRMLKEIRQKIADENDIPYVTEECRHQGNCTGTCPRCESELRYLEQQLARRAALGKRITVAALCAGMAFTGFACGAGKPGSDDDITELSGEVAPYETPCPDDEPDVEILMGDAAVPFDADEDPDVSPAPEDDDIEHVEFEISGMLPYAGSDFSGND